MVDFVDHVGLSFDFSEFFDSVDFGSGLGPATSVGHAVFALDHGGAADSVVAAVGLVGGAGLVGDVVVVDPFIGVFGITSSTALIGVLAGDEDLGAEVDIGPLRVSGDFDSVGEGGGGGEGPAGAAVDGDVLISLEGEEVGVVDFAPPEVFG